MGGRGEEGTPVAVEVPVNEISRSASHKRKESPLNGARVGANLVPLHLIEGRLLSSDWGPRHGIEPWTPYQLRHAAATRFEEALGFEAASKVLGHHSAAVTLR